MPFPNYTEAEIILEIQKIDAAIADLPNTATRFSIERKSFDFSGKLTELQTLRAWWMERYEALASATSASARSMRAVMVSGRSRQEWNVLGIYPSRRRRG